MGAGSVHVKMNAKVEAAAVAVQAEVNATCPLSVLLYEKREIKVEETAGTVDRDQKDRAGAEKRRKG